MKARAYVSCQDAHAAPILSPLGLSFLAQHQKRKFAAAKPPPNPPCCAHILADFGIRRCGHLGRVLFRGERRSFGGAKTNSKKSASCIARMYIAGWANGSGSSPFAGLRTSLPPVGRGTCGVHGASIDVAVALARLWGSPQKFAHGAILIWRNDRKL